VHQDKINFLLKGIKKLIERVSTLLLIRNERKNDEHEEDDEHFRRDFYVVSNKEWNKFSLSQV